MGQLSLTYRASHSGAEAWQRQLDVLRIAVEHLGRKEVAFEIDVSGSALSDALNERDRKRWAAEWTHVIKAMLQAKHDEISADLLRKICEADLTVTRFVVEEPVEMSSMEVAIAYGQLDEAAKAAIARVLGKGKRK